jgi:glycolate oxidase iron-sulfur subunit
VTENRGQNALGLDPDELSSCVQCGLCLPHCPTFRVTGREAYSPRGRIALMRRVEAGDGVIDVELADAMTSCVQCRGCEPACPSAVPFGHLMEQTRARLPVPRWQRAAYWVLGRHRLLVGLSRVGAVAQRAGLVPWRLVPYQLPLRQERLRPSGDDVWLFTGCVMDAWQRPVHAAVQRVMEAAGAGVALPGPGAACCGALHAHAGLSTAADRLAARVVASFPGEAPIVVDSAGCGAALQGYDDRAFAARVVDVHTWLAGRLDRLPAVRPLDLTVAVQDPCHLRHVQRAHLPVRDVLRPFVQRIVELDDDGLCCGAGGAFAVTRRDLAGDMRARKLQAIERAAADVVVSANPGCTLHLAAAGVRVVHPLELIDQAVHGEWSLLR